MNEPRYMEIKFGVERIKTLTTSELENLVISRAKEIETDGWDFCLTFDQLTALFEDLAKEMAEDTD